MWVTATRVGRLPTGRQADLMGRPVTRPWRAIALHGTYACRAPAAVRARRPSLPAAQLRSRGALRPAWMFLSFLQVLVPVHFLLGSMYNVWYYNRAVR